MKPANSFQIQHWLTRSVFLKAQKAESPICSTFETKCFYYICCVGRALLANFVSHSWESVFAHAVFSNLHCIILEACCMLLLGPCWVIKRAPPTSNADLDAGQNGALIFKQTSFGGGWDRKSTKATPTGPVKTISASSKTALIYFEWFFLK